MCFEGNSRLLEMTIKDHFPLVMAALHNRCGHYIFALWFLSFFFILF